MDRVIEREGRLSWKVGIAVVLILLVGFMVWLVLGQRPGRSLVVDHKRIVISSLPQTSSLRARTDSSWDRGLQPAIGLAPSPFRTWTAETDFPHPTCLYGEEVHKRIAAGLGDCEPEVRRKILWGNGERLYKVEPPTPEDLAKIA